MPCAAGGTGSWPAMSARRASVLPACRASGRTSPRASRSPTPPLTVSCPPRCWNTSRTPITSRENAPASCVPAGRSSLTTPNILSVYSRLHFLLLGTCDFFDTPSGSRETAFHGAKGHINPVGYPELRYLFARAGLRITDVTTNRDIRVALRDTTGWARWARPALAVVASAARLTTRLTRRTDRVALQLLSPALLFGENLIVRGVRPSREDGEHA